MVAKKVCVCGVLLCVIAPLVGNCASVRTSTEQAPPPQEQEEILATVNGVKIPLSSFRAVIPKNKDPKDITNEQCAKILEGLVQRELVYQDALTQGIDKDPGIQKQLSDGIENLKRHLYLNAISEKTIKPQVVVSEEEVQDFYQKNIQRYTTVPEVRARQIVVYDKKEAEKLRRQIKGVEDFVKIAHEKSIDPFSSPFGGDLGYLKQGEYLPEAERLMQTLPPGEISEPLKTKYGYHIFMVVDRKLARIKPLEEVREEIEKQLKNQKEIKLAQEYVDQLRAKAAIEINESLINSLCMPKASPPEEQAPEKGNAE